MTEQQVLKRKTLGFVHKSQAEAETVYRYLWEEMICIFLSDLIITVTDKGLTWWLRW